MVGLFRQSWGELYIEHYLEQYISIKLKNTDGFFGRYGLNFEKKICLAQSLGGLNAQLIDGIRKLNNLRNNCVHELSYQPTEKQIDELGRIFGKAYREMKSKYAQNLEGLLLQCCSALAGVWRGNAKGRQCTTHDSERRAKIAVINSAANYRNLQKH